MIISKLIEYYDNNPDIFQDSDYYRQSKLHYIIHLTDDGKLDAIIPTKSDNNKEMFISAPCFTVGRTSGIKPQLLIDSAGYVLGAVLEDEKPARASKMHDAFVDLLKECYEKTQNEKLAVVIKFLESEAEVKSAIENLDPKTKKKDILTFCVDGEYVFDDASIVKFWEDKNSEFEFNIEDHCMFCGEIRPILPLHYEIRIKGVGNISLVSANSEVYEWGGLKGTECAPTCASCAMKYRKALEYIANNNIYSALDITYIWWSDEDSDNIDSLIFDTQPEAVRDLLSSPYKPSKFQDINNFYLMSFKKTNTRVSICDFVCSPLDRIKNNIRVCFESQQRAFDGQEFHPIGIKSLINALLINGKEFPKNVAANIANAFIQHFLYGKALPDSLLYTLVNRLMAESNSITKSRLVLLSMILKRGEEMDERFSLANKLGRLYFFLDTMRSETTGAEKGHLERMAASYPDATFPSLCEKNRYHSNKLLKNEKAGIAKAMVKRISELLAEIGELGGFPKALDYKQKGEFFIGYAEQTQLWYAKKETKKESEDGDE